MGANAGAGKPCSGRGRSLEPRTVLTGAHDMSTVAALFIIGFLAVMAVLNRVEFGRID